MAILWRAIARPVCPCHQYRHDYLMNGVPLPITRVVPIFSALLDSLTARVTAQWFVSRTLLKINDTHIEFFSGGGFIYQKWFTDFCF